MNFSMFLTETTAGAAKSSSGSLIMTLVMVAVLGAAMYFFMYLPQKKQDKKNNEMKNSLSVGDEVTTVGRVISIKDDSFVLETTKDRTKIRFLRSALRSIDVKADSGDDDTAAAADKADSKALPKAELKDVPNPNDK